MLRGRSEGRRMERGKRELEGRGFEEMGIRKMHLRVKFI